MNDVYILERKSLRGRGEALVARAARIGGDKRRERQQSGDHQEPQQPFSIRARSWLLRTVPEVSCSIATEVSNCLVIKSSRILCNQVLRFLLSAHHGEYNWNKEESCDGGEQQSANNRAAEGRILFASFAESEGHGHHADDHRESGHHHRPQPCAAGLEV